jgi:BlaI family transcriptional regulator, penicillinase repressor
MARAAAARELPPPLELMCLQALWSLGDANVRDVRQAVSGRKTLAYTTVMTLLERLARKGLVSRRKMGRSFLYAAQIPRDTLRRIAMREFLAAYFDGSEDQLLDFLYVERSVPEEPAPEFKFEPEPRLDTALL